MREEHPAWIEYQRKRWMRGDAERWWRPDAARWMTPDEARLLLPESMQPTEHKDDVAPATAALSREAARVERLRLLKIKSDILALRFQRALLLRIRDLERRANFNPNQPRVPAGNSDGGRWTSESGVSDASPRINDPRVISDASPDAMRPGTQFAEARRPGIGHNNPPPDTPPPDTPPKVPRRRPPTSQERHRIAREVARWPGREERYYRIGEWLRELAPSIRAYKDPPKTLEELQNAVTDDSTPGYDDHHVVERHARRDPGRNWPESWIDDGDNIVRIPRFKHWAINSWYARPNDDPPYNGRSPREYLRGKTWDERYRIGLEVLRRYGVLEP